MESYQGFAGLKGFAVLLKFFLVAEWIHLTLFGIKLPTIKLKMYAFLGLMNSATKFSTLDLVGTVFLDVNAT